MSHEKAALIPQELLLVAIGSLWLAGIFLGSLITIPPLTLLVGAGAILVSLIPLWQDHRGALILLLLFCLLLGAWRYSIALPANTPQSITAYIGDTALQAQGTVADEPKVQRRSRMLLVAVSQVSSDGGKSWQAATGNITVQTLGSSIESPYGANYGDTIRLQGKLQAPEPQPVPTTFASMAFPRVSVQGSGGNPIIGWLYHLRVQFANIIAQALPQPEAALLIALLLSLHTPALSPLLPAFNATGTAHLIAPSGFKVTILAGIVASLMSRLEQSPEKKLGRVRIRARWLTTAVTVTTIIVYTLLSGAGPAALRAGIMGILSVTSRRTEHTYNVYTALSLAAILITALDPFALWSISFLLSFLGTLGIVLLTPFFVRLLHPIARLPFGHTLVEIMAVTLAAQFATFPILTIVFQQVSLIALLANIVTVPLLGTFLLLGLAVSIGGLISLPLGILCGWLAWPIMWYLVVVINTCASLPGASISIGTLSNALAWGYYGLLLVLMVMILPGNEASSTLQSQKTTPATSHSRHIRRLLQACAAILIILGTGASTLVPQNSDHFSISFLDVGPAGAESQGEAIFVRTAQGQTALIDGGLDPISLSQALDSRLPSWQRTLDLVLLTTARPEHITGLLDIIQRFQVKEVIDAGMLHPNTTYALWRRTITERNLRYQSVTEGATIPIGTEVTLQVLSPQSLHKGSNEERDNSLVVRIQAPGMHILLLGAAAQSTYALTGLVTNLASTYLQAEVVQMVGETNKAYPTALQEILQEAHPTILIVTPPKLSAKQHNKTVSGDLTPIHPLLSTPSDCQMIQTAQTGTVEVESSANGWNMNIL